MKLVLKLIFVASEPLFLFLNVDDEHSSETDFCCCFSSDLNCYTSCGFGMLSLVTGLQFGRLWLMLFCETVMVFCWEVCSLFACC